MIPAYLLLLLPGDVLGLAGVGGVTPPVGDSVMVCGRVFVNPMVRGVVQINPLVSGKVSARSMVRGVVQVAECGCDG